MMYAFKAKVFMRPKAQPKWPFFAYDVALCSCDQRTPNNDDIVAALIEQGYIVHHVADIQHIGEPCGPVVAFSVEPDEDIPSFREH